MNTGTPHKASIRISNGGLGDDGTSDYNEARRAALLALIDEYGVNETARMFEVNAYYISNIKNDPDYIPRSHIICEKLGFRYYKLIVPRSTAKRKTPRRAINLLDPESAAISILNSEASDLYIARLAELLSVKGR